MKAKEISIVKDVLNHQIFDKNQERFGKVDDIIFYEKTGEVQAILSGPGAYTRGIPTFFAVLLQKIAGTNINKISWNNIKDITSSVNLSKSIKELGFIDPEQEVRKWMKSATKI